MVSNFLLTFWGIWCGRVWAGGSVTPRLQGSECRGKMRIESSASPAAGGSRDMPAAKIGLDCWVSVEHLSGGEEGP